MDVRMAWIIGGPGSGKTTQALKIARQYGFIYIDPCALVKQVEIKEATGKHKDTSTISVPKRESQLPLQNLIPLIETKMNSARSKGVVIDGYPANLEDAVLLETGIGEPDIVIALEVDEETSTRRSAEIQHSFNRPTLTEYQLTSRAVVERYEDITAKVDSSPQPHIVFEVIQFNIDSLNMAEVRNSKARRFNSLG